MTDSGYDKPDLHSSDIPDEVLHNLCSQDNENGDTSTSDKENQNSKMETFSIEVKEDKYLNPLLDNKKANKNNNHEKCCSCQCIGDCFSDAFSGENLLCYGLNILFWGWLFLVILHYMDIITLPRSKKVFTNWDFSNLSGDGEAALILLVFYIIFFFISIIIIIYIELLVVLLYLAYIYFSLPIYEDKYLGNPFACIFYMLTLGEFYRCFYRCCNVYKEDY